MSDYLPVFQLTRGQVVESIHFGALAVVSVHGELLAHYGNPHAKTFLRSTAKPLQALPFVEQEGPQAFQLTEAEIALTCASHSGTDQHAATAASIQAKANFTEADLRCGVHPPIDKATDEALRARGEEPTPNRQNCSGKHSGMLAYARLNGWPLDNYLEHDHPAQQNILRTFAEMCDLSAEDVGLGTDGCSAPNFAAPLYNVALAYARFADPSSLPPPRAAACHTITQAMTTHPNMVGGPGRFDTCLMEAAGGRLFAKGGAEGYQGIGLMPGTLAPGSPAIGIALKISDGNRRGSAGPAVALEILHQLNVLTPEEQKALETFGPRFAIQNWRKIVVGEGKPCFRLVMK